MEERSEIIELQIKISHQEQLLEELNQALIFQQKQIDVLQNQLKSLTDSQKANAPIKSQSEEVPPPHY